MAQYRAIIRSKNGSTSRLGNKKEGMVVRVDGWNIGVKVMIMYNEELACDQITIFETGGSNDPGIQSWGPTYTEEHREAE